MTGKTSLASLVSQALARRQNEEMKCTAVFSLSMNGIPDDMTFVQFSKTRCGIGWTETTFHLLASGCRVYLVFDETQML